MMFSNFALWLFIHFCACIGFSFNIVSSHADVSELNFTLVLLFLLVVLIKKD